MKLNTFELPSQLLMNRVKETAINLANWFKEQCAASTDDFDIFTVSGNNVEEIDAAGLQLLMSFDHECTVSSRLWTLQNASETLDKACQMLKLNFDISASKSTSCTTQEGQR